MPSEDPKEAGAASNDAIATPSAAPATPDMPSDRFFNISLDLLCIAGLDGYFKRLNPAWEKTLGFSIEELLSRPSVEFIHPDDRQRSRGLAVDLRGGVDVIRYENRYLCKDGSYRWISWTCSAIRAGDPFLYAAGRDVTEERLAQEKLDRKTAELQAVFSALPDLLFRTDAEGRLVDYSAGQTSDLYVPPDVFLGKTFAEVLPSDVACALDVAIKRAATSQTVECLEYKLDVPSGEQRFEARVVPFLEGQSITVVRNVTDRWLAQERLTKSEERLRESEKLEAIGRLAGGIAHDFNNLMMAVLTYTDILLRRVDTADPNRRELAEIRGAGERATRLTKQLLAFAQRQFLVPTVLDPGAIIRDVEGMLRDVIGERIDLTSSCAAQLWTVRVDRSQLEQVVLNLALNARDAMPAGGHLDITATNAEINEAEARRLRLDRAGDYVRLSVADTGCGIGPTDLPHLFEPFFTTKSPGGGTGLGLATVYGVVGQSGGAVSVETAPGQGATFTIFLPRALEKPEIVAPPEVVSPARGDETLLLVEDDTAVRRAIGQTLRSFGYLVLEAENAAAALQLAENHKGDIHLLLTDVVMPGQSGFELAARLREARSDVRVLFMSGYASDMSVPGSSPPGAVMLQKPFAPDTLAQQVREILASELRRS